MTLAHDVIHPAAPGAAHDCRESFTSAERERMDARGGSPPFRQIANLPVLTTRAVGGVGGVTPFLRGEGVSQ